MTALTLADKRYASAPWVPPIAHYPRARLTEWMAGVLEQHYLHAQQHARFLGATSYGYDLRDLESLTVPRHRAIFSADLAAIHRARGTIPRQTSHVRAYVLYSMTTVFPVTGHFRLKVKDAAANEDVSATLDVVHEYAQPPGSEDRRHDFPFRADYPFTSRNEVYLESLLLELDNVDGLNPGRCLITLEGYAAFTGAPIAAWLWPLYAAVYAEMNY